MAKKRMMTREIDDTGSFRSMSGTAQALYHAMSLHADDEGIGDNLAGDMFATHANKKHLSELLPEGNGKGFVMLFKVKGMNLYVIKHWFLANKMDTQHFTRTIYLQVESQLYVKSDNSYTLDPKKSYLSATEYIQKTYPKAFEMTPTCHESATEVPPTCQQVSRDLGKVSIEEVSIDNKDTPEVVSSTESKPVKTSLKQSGLCGILVNFGFLEEDELKDKQWDDLLDEYSKTHDYVDLKIKITFIMKTISKLTNKGLDRNDKPIYAWHVDEEAMNSIGSKFPWFSTALEKAFRNWEKDDSPKGFLNQLDDETIADLFPPTKDDNGKDL